MRKVSYLRIMICVLVLSIILGCSMMQDKRMSEEKIISGTGTVKFVDLEGGFYGIVGDDGKNYDPINLSQEFQVDGLRVRFEAKIPEDVVSIRMWGTSVEILKIQKLE